MKPVRFTRFSPLTGVSLAFGALLTLAACTAETPLEASKAVADPSEESSSPAGLQMTDTLTAALPAASLTGTWTIRQVNKNGAVYLGTLSLLQTGRLLVGRADWSNHPDGHLLGYATANRVVLGQGFTDTSKANLLGFYSATLAANGDSLVQGLSVSSGLDSGVWVAARVSACPALPLTPEPLPCQLGGADTVSTPPDTGATTPSDSGLIYCGLQPVPDSATSLARCWRITQTGKSGAYSGQLLFDDMGSDTLKGRAVWDSHPTGTLRGSVVSEVAINLPAPPPPPRVVVRFVQSFVGEKAALNGHYIGVLRADGTLSGTAWASQGGTPSGDSATWSAAPIACPSLP